jgi:DNA-binding MarR family transcriptional regulator
MNGLVFHLKRAWQSVLYRICAKEVAPFGLTPARFDMLTAIGDGVTQARLCRLLGVSRPVVSRMLAALERLRLVTRRLMGRTRWVEMTQAGLERLRRAGGVAGDSGSARRRLGDALDIQGQSELEIWLEELRKGIGDRAELTFASEFDNTLESWS